LTAQYHIPVTFSWEKSDLYRVEEETMQGLLFGISKSSKPVSNPFFTKNVQSVQTAMAHILVRQK
jgi:hypothetical protein